jgi:hypothetical protein
MLSDKEIALRLLDMIEDLIVQKLALESVLETLHGHQWDSTLKAMEHSAAGRATIHAKIEPLRQQVLDAPDLTATVRAILESLERKPGEDETN